MKNLIIVIVAIASLLFGVSGYLIGINSTNNTSYQQGYKRAEAVITNEYLTRLNVGDRWVVLDGGMYPFPSNYCLYITQNAVGDLEVRIDKRGEQDSYSTLTSLWWRIEIKNWNFTGTSLDGK